MRANLKWLLALRLLILIFGDMSEGYEPCHTLQHKLFGFNSSFDFNPCQPFVTYPYFLPRGLAPQDLEDLAVAFLINSELYSQAPNCRIDYTKLVCSSIYQACNTTQSLTWNTSMPIREISNPPCRCMCEDASVSCSAGSANLTFPGFGAQNGNCSVQVQYRSLFESTDPSVWSNWTDPSSDYVFQFEDVKCFDLDTLQTDFPVGGGWGSDDFTVFPVFPPDPFPIPTDWKCNVTCPLGFAIRDCSDRQLSSTKCEPACRSPVWTSEQWDLLVDLGLKSSIIGFCLMLISIVSRLLDPKTCMQYMVFVFTGSSAILSAFFIALFSQPSAFQHTFCRDELTALNNENSLSLCTVQSLIMVYLLLVGALAWAAQVINLAVKLAFSVDPSAYVITNCVLVLGLPVIPTILAGSLGTWGFTQYTPWCSPGFGQGESFKNIDLYVLYFPVLVILFISVCGMGPVSNQIAYTLVASMHSSSKKLPKVKRSPGAIATVTNLSSSKKSAQNPSIKFPGVSPADAEAGGGSGQGSAQVGESDRSVSDRSASRRLSGVILSSVSLNLHSLDIVRAPLAFLLPFLTMWLSVIVVRLMLHKDDANQQLLVGHWSQCVLDSYNGFSDESWQTVCGAQPDSDISFKLMAWLTFCVTGQSIFVVIIHPPTLRLKTVFSYVWKKIQTRITAYKRRKVAVENLAKQDIPAVPHALSNAALSHHGLSSLNKSLFVRLSDAPSHREIPSFRSAHSGKERDQFMLANNAENDQLRPGNSWRERHGNSRDAFDPLPNRSENQTHMMSKSGKSILPVVRPVVLAAVSGRMAPSRVHSEWEEKSEGNEETSTLEAYSAGIHADSRFISSAPLQPIADSGPVNEYHSESSPRHQSSQKLWEQGGVCTDADAVS